MLYCGAVCQSFDSQSETLGDAKFGVFVSQFYPVCNFGEFINFGLQALSGVKGLSVVNQLPPNVCWFITTVGAHNVSGRSS